MPRHRIRAHYEQLSELERGRTIELKEVGWKHADWGRIVFSEESRFQMHPDHHRRRVRRRPNLLSLLHASQTFNKELWPWMPFLLKPDPFGCP
ncbi:hypothetical protein TNCV_2279551 [Trichonephila clavipes]|uniref:Uncharacterized protein n=1 Tax=Trichonephila clavipes TaxID=2585209 RepID=A0A8X6UY89_TRICX|nr:hypothetical protein TNCV_2279551 [Trichonephila clavipes]